MEQQQRLAASMGVAPTSFAESTTVPSRPLNTPMLEPAMYTPEQMYARLANTRPAVGVQINPNPAMTPATPITESFTAATGLSSSDALVRRLYDEIIQLKEKFTMMSATTSGGSSYASSPSTYVFTFPSLAALASYYEMFYYFILGLMVMYLMIHSQ
jgi:hypothetical protein